jgi:predicted Zn-dependent peptidase
VDLLAIILGDSRSARLRRSIRDGLGIVTSISASYSALEAAGLLMVAAQLEPRDVGRAEVEILREVRRIQIAGVTEAELRRAIALAEARQEREVETAEGRAWMLGRAETVWRVDEDLAYLDRVRSVAPDHVRTVAQRYLDADRYVRVALLPGTS